MPLDCDGYDARTLSPPEISSSYNPLPMRGVEGGEDDREDDRRGGDCSAGELELGLSLRSGVAASKANAAPWGDYCRILTAKDFPSPAAASVYASTAQQRRHKPASAGYDAGIDNGSNASSPVVGWPPLRAFRINSLFHHSKDNGGFSDDENGNTNQKTENKKSPRKDRDDAVAERGFISRTGAAAVPPPVTAKAARGKKRSGSLFVKVKMDGMPIGRKVNLSAHQSYEALALALEDMFQAPAIRNKQDSSKASSLLDGSSEFVLTYEDRDGDWMLVGDVPWGMFVGTARRLRIMRTTDANGLATTGFHPVNSTQN